MTGLLVIPNGVTTNQVFLSFGRFVWQAECCTLGPSHVLVRRQSAVRLDPRAWRRAINRWY
jgi:hypothetical protein